MAQAADRFRSLGGAAAIGILVLAVYSSCLEGPPFFDEAHLLDPGAR